MFLRQDVADFIKLLKETPIEEREVFLSIRKKAVSEIGKSAVALQGWLESTKTFRSDELNELRHSRRKAILEKLREDGRWQEELGEMETTCYLEERFNMLPEVRKLQALTAKIWANIKGPVIAFMQQRKDERIAEMRRMAMEDRMRAMCEFAKTILMRIPDPRILALNCRNRNPCPGDSASDRPRRTHIQSRRPRGTNQEAPSSGSTRQTRGVPSKYRARMWYGWLHGSVCSSTCRWCAVCVHVVWVRGTALPSSSHLPQVPLRIRTPTREA
ncbi:hypothetical protein BC629DRAFT_322246 [Irpex lacteus]|nr:hypothetical protein BC629DRAFT_322246 [Irpex lacteus]